MRLLGILLATTTLTLGAWAAQEPESPIAQLTPEDLAAGEKSFIGACGNCHGIDGSGGEGPALNRPHLTHAQTDAELFMVIRRGIPGGGMPGNRALREKDAWRVAGFVRSLGAVPSEPLAGDPLRGKELYDEQGCEACHILGGVGRGIGPELTSIGSRRGASHLRQSLVDPGAVVADEYLFVRVTTADGRVEGLRLNEDAFTIQIRDAQNRLHSFDKSELEGLTKVPGRSIMLPYRRLSSEELDDLVAYLASLTGDR